MHKEAKSDMNIQILNIKYFSQFLHLQLVNFNHLNDILFIWFI